MNVSNYSYNRTKIQVDYSGSIIPTYVIIILVLYFLLEVIYLTSSDKCCIAIECIIGLFEELDNLIKKILGFISIRCLNRYNNLKQNIYDRSCKRCESPPNLQRSNSNSSEEDYSDNEYNINIQPQLDLFKESQEMISIYIPNNNEECVICQEIIESKNSKEESYEIVKLECGHLYHKTCIENWYEFSKNKDCPTCRQEISIKEYLK